MADSKDSGTDQAHRGFLNRWSERKQSARDEREGKDRHEVGQLVDPQSESEQEASSLGLSEEEIAALPDPESLTENSDFTPFMQEGVPENLKRLALRRLWRVNPLIGEVDGLLDYDLDYTDAATVVKNLQTLYQVGKGMVLEEDEDEEVGRDKAEGPETAALKAAGEEDAQSQAQADLENEDLPAEDPQNPDLNAGLEPHPGQDPRPLSEGMSSPLSSAPADTAPDPSEADRSEKAVLPAGQGRPEPRPAVTPGQAVKRRWGAFS
ncbi:DUF3306 domain-containing protein [Rhodovibrionaceae bacterium A322]